MKRWYIFQQLRIFSSPDRRCTAGYVLSRANLPARQLQRHRQYYQNRNEGSTHGERVAGCAKDGARRAKKKPADDCLITLTPLVEQVDSLHKWQRRGRLSAVSPPSSMPLGYILHSVRCVSGFVGSSYVQLFCFDTSVCRRWCIHCS